MSNGSLGFRFGAEGVGRWNLDLGDTVPLLSADGPGPDGLSESVLGAVIILGMVNTVVANMFGHYDYRTGVSIWFRGIFRLDLHPDLMSQAPIGFQLHALAAFLLFALWPFTRLVHAFSAPIGYLWRPYVVYRSKDEKLGNRAQRPGWGRTGERIPR